MILSTHAVTPMRALTANSSPSSRDRKVTETSPHMATIHVVLSSFSTYWSVSFPPESANKIQ